MKKATLNTVKRYKGFRLEQRGNRGLWTVYKGKQFIWIYDSLRAALASIDNRGNASEFMFNNIDELPF